MSNLKDDIEYSIKKEMNFLEKIESEVDQFEYNINNSRNIKSVKKDLLDNPRYSRKIIQKNLDYCRKNSIRLSNLLNKKLKKLSSNIIKNKNKLVREANSKKSKMSRDEQRDFRNSVINPLKKVYKRFDTLKQKEKKVRQKLAKATQGFKCDSHKMNGFLSGIQKYNRNSLKRSVKSHYKKYNEHVYYDPRQCRVIGIYPKDYSKQYQYKKELEKIKKTIDGSKFGITCLKKRNMNESKIAIEYIKPMSI